MIINDEVVKKISELAKLENTEEEQKKFASQLSDILEHMESLSKLNADGVEPMYHGCVEQRKLREDSVVQYDHASVMETQRDVEDNFYTVPSIIGED